jgi:1-phosphofructokinase family hexose kinase
VATTKPAGMIYTVTLNPAIDRELTVPAIAFDTVLRAGECRVDAGGKGFNVSRMLMALGEPSVAFAFAGGHNGRVLEDALRAMGIETDFTQIKGETRVNISIAEASAARYVKVNEPGPPVDDAMLGVLLEKLVKRVRPGDWCVLAGSLPPGVATTVYASLVAALNERGVMSCVDASGDALRDACRARPYLVKPNLDELRGITGQTADTYQAIGAAAHEVTQLGAQNVIVSMGKQGALFLDDAGLWHARSPQIRESNPIGSGDSMVAGLIWSLNLKMGWHDAMRWALACGAATASLPGTRVGSRALVESLLPEVAFGQA